MSAPPLTHHQIVGLLPPFVRRGQQLDLGASDRTQRQLLFKPVEGCGDASCETTGDEGDALKLTQTLQLDCHASGSFSLTRVLRRHDGLQASLSASGTQVDALLAQIDAVDPTVHFKLGPGFVLARSYELPTAGAAPRFSEGVVQVDGLVMTLRVKDLRGRAGDITLAAATADAPDLPQDLLSVLGWDWSPLTRTRDGWTAKLRLRGGTPRRTRKAEAMLDVAAIHLAQVMGEAPQRFHSRHFAARLGVVLRRSIPLATAIGMVLGALSLTRMPVQGNAGLFMLLHYGSIVLLVLSFGLQEEARFEIPPWPRKPKAGSWRHDAAVRVED